MVTYNLEPIHPLSDFIQERALGGLIRQWLMMGEAERSVSINAFLEKDIQSHIDTMEKTLLHLAASYPNRAVRTELIWLYGLYVKESNKLPRFTPGTLTDDYELTAPIFFEPSGT